MSVVEGLRLGWRRTLPVVLQTEAAECGLACLAMVASYHGHALDLAVLRRQFSVSLHGATLADLAACAERLGLAARAVRLELEDLCHLKLPCVLHWNFNHFVVLVRVRAGGITIHDPRRGARAVPLEEAAQAFTGVALELWPGARFAPRRRDPAVRLRDLVGPIAGLKAALAHVLVLAVSLELFLLANPLLVQWTVDHVLITASRDLLTLLALGFGLLVLCEQATAALRSFVIMQLSCTLNIQWHSNVLAHLLTLPLPYFEKRHLGDVVSRFRSIDGIQRTVTTAFVEAIVDGGMSVLLLAVMAWYAPLLAGVCLIATTLYALARGVSHTPLREAAEEQIAGAAEQDSHFLETVRGVKAVKLFRRQAERRAAWLKLMVAQVNAGLRAQRVQLALRSMHGTLFGLEHVLVVYLGAGLVLDGGFSTGMLLAFVAYRRQFAGRVSALIDKAFEVRLLRLHGERLADIVLTEAEPQPQRIAATREERMSAVGVRLEGLRYRYAERGPYVLDGVDLEVSAGECVAIMGASGCGKSTLVSLLLGILPAAGGEVRVAGRPLVEFGEARFRTLVAAVTQNDCLFAGSIADNISFFDSDPDQAWIEECAGVAAVHTDVAALPMGYNTLVGFLGSALSAGQQQRVLLARALYARPALLVLDEATSHLDVTREEQVVAGLRQLAMTRIVIAHRRETLAAADRVLRLEKGRLVATALGRAAALGDALSAREGRVLGNAEPLPRVPLGTVSAEQQALLGSLGC